MTGRLWPSALVAGLFAIHPLRVESVAWVTERKDVLSGLFFVLTLGAYLEYVRQPFSLERYLTVTVLFALGLLSKAMLVTVPLVLLLIDYWPLGRFAERRLSALGYLLLEKLPWFALVAASCGMTVWSHAKVLTAVDRLPIGWRLGNALVSYVAYLGSFFCPTGLAVLYPAAELDLRPWKVGGAALLLLAITVAAWLGRRRCPYLLFGWLWYVGMLLPVIGLLQFGVFTHADRFTYLPQIGIAVALAWGAADLCRARSYRRPLCAIASLLVLAVLMGCAWRQASFWQDSETLWTRALRCTSRNKLAQNNLGNHLADRERLAEAVEHYREALKIDPRYVDAHFNLGAALFGQGRYEEAIAQYRQAVDIQPDFMLGYNNLGEVFARQSRLDEAITQYQKALAIQPDSVLALNGLGEVLARRGRPAEAVAQFRKVLEILPDYVETLKNLAWLRATCPEGDMRNGRQAVELAERATRLCGGGRADVLDALAAAYAETGRFSETRAAARRALELARQSGDHSLANALAARIALYEAGRPYRQPPAATP